MSKTSTRRLLSREDILAKGSELQVREVEVPEWGGFVRLRELTSSERTRVELSMVQQRQGRGGNQVDMSAYPRLRGRVLARSIVDEANHLLFTEADIEAFAEMGAGPIERLFAVACAMSGLSQQDVESMVGNSASTPNDDSPSA